MPKVLALQLPAICPLHCAFCRTPQHGEGDMEAVKKTAFERLDEHTEVYLTSNGETGFAKGFAEFVAKLISLGTHASVLCATERSVVPGLKRVEVSVNNYTLPLSLRAVKKANDLGIPVVVSMVDDGNGQLENIEAIANQYHAQGVLVRAQQKEGRAQISVGTTRVWKKEGVDLGFFPVAAYRELEGIGIPAFCVNHFGQMVPFLGSPVFDRA